MQAKDKLTLSNLNDEAYGEFYDTDKLTPYEEKILFKEIENLHRFFEKILSYYECPESCEAVCCKPSIVTFTRKEYRKALENKNYRHILETQTSKVRNAGRYSSLKSLQPFRRFNHEECPVLQNNKCGIYPQRPWLCRTYPFTPQPDGWGLVLCQLGFEVFLDYSISVIVFGIFVIREKDKLPSRVLNWATVIAKNIPNPVLIVLPQNSEMGNFVELLNNFRIYLHSLPKNYRYKIREKSLTFFEICYNDQATENIACDYITQVKELVIEGERETAKET